MKKLFAVLIALVVVFGFSGCEQPGNNNDDPDNASTSTTLTITNQSSYDLLNVTYSTVGFGDLSVGKESIKDVSADSKPVYFYLEILGTNVHCKTNDLITCEEGEEVEQAITNNTTVTAVTSGQSGILSKVYEMLPSSLNKAVLELSQGDTVITNNESLPFDFGKVEVGSSKSFVFTIKSAGNVPLELTGDPLIVSSNSVFSVSTQPGNQTISPGLSSTFMMQYNPTTEIEDTGTITIRNNSDSMIFTLNIKGTGYVKQPRITVTQGDSTIDPNGEYDFGSIFYADDKDITFTITNSGDLNLTFVDNAAGSPVRLEDDMAAFYIIEQPSLSTIVTPANTAEFKIRFSPPEVGSYSAKLVVSTNSHENASFSFSLTGAGRAEEYIIGDTGPAGGIVFYDKGEATDGWRYMEAAPSETEFSAQWGADNQDISGFGIIGTDIGTGAENTTIIESYLNFIGETGKAAQLCRGITTSGGYSDWFLPSQSELNLMYRNLKEKGLGNFKEESYWSSSEYNFFVAWSQNFKNKDSFDYSSKNDSLYVRAIRTF